MNNIENKYSRLIIGHLEGDLSVEEENDFYNRVNLNDENKKIYFQTKALYESRKKRTNNIDLDESWQRLLEKRQVRKGEKTFNFFSHFTSYAAVAMLSIIITSSFFFLSSKEEDEQTHSFISGNGLKADQMELPDGSKVSIGANTIVTYDNNYGKKDRIVYIKGEAYFEVAKQKNKPFIVKTNDQSIKALGTKFNVSAYSTDSLQTTTLMEGSVRLDTKAISEATILKPNEQFIYNKNSKQTHLKKVDASQYIAWASGYYYFHKQTLETILYRLGHVYGKEFIINSEKLKDQKFTGTFYRGQSIKDILEIIQLSLPIEYKIKDRQVIISEI